MAAAGTRELGIRHGTPVGRFGGNFFLGGATLAGRKEHGIFWEGSRSASTEKAGFTGAHMHKLDKEEHHTRPLQQETNTKS